MNKRIMILLLFLIVIPIAYSLPSLFITRDILGNIVIGTTGCTGLIFRQTTFIQENSWVKEEIISFISKDEIRRILGYNPLNSGKKIQLSIFESSILGGFGRTYSDDGTIEIDAHLFSKNDPRKYVEEQGMEYDENKEIFKLFDVLVKSDEKILRLYRDLLVVHELSHAGERFSLIGEEKETKHGVTTRIEIKILTELLLAGEIDKETYEFLFDIYKKYMNDDKEDENVIEEYRSQVLINYFDYLVSDIMEKINYLKGLPEEERNNLVYNDYYLHSTVRKISAFWNKISELNLFNKLTDKDIDDLIDLYIEPGGAFRNVVRKKIFFFSKSFYDIYYSEELANLPEAEKHSFALAIWRYYRDSGKTIHESINFIKEERANFRDIEILNNKKNIIVFTNEEFGDKDIITFALRRNVPSESIINFKGEKKQDFLKAIKESGGETVIWFLGHGWKTELELSVNEYINYTELGDALIERGNIPEVILIIDSCLGNDFARNLKDYLTGSRGECDFPLVITSANKGDVLVEGLRDPSVMFLITNLISLENREFLSPETFVGPYYMQPLTGEHIILAGGHVFFNCIQIAMDTQNGNCVYCTEESCVLG